MSRNKVLLRGIKTNLFSFCMVFFSTLLVVVVLVVNFSFQQSVVSTRIEQLRNATLNTQIAVNKARNADDSSNNNTGANGNNTNPDAGTNETTPGSTTDPSTDPENKASTVFRVDQVENILKGNSNVRAWVEGLSFEVSSKMKTKRIHFYGINLDQQKAVYPIEVVEGTVDFAEENGVIVSETFARDNSLKLNDTFKFYLRDESETEQDPEAGEGLNDPEAGQDQEAGQDAEAGQQKPSAALDGFEVVIKGISRDAGIFAQEQGLVIGKLAFGQKSFELAGRLNRLDVELHELELITVTTEELNAELTKLNLNIQAQQKFDLDYFDTYVSTVVLALNLFVSVMVLVSIYIVLSVFRSYVYQNMREMVTLRSIGFTINNYRALMIGQVVLISLVSSLVGVGLSIPGVRVLLAIFVGDSSRSELNFSAVAIVVISACVISGLSAWLATRKVTRTPIIDILKKNLVQKKSSARTIMFSMGLLIWFFAVGILYVAEMFGVAAYFVVVGLGLIGFILLHDYLVYAFSRLIEFLLGRLPRALGLFAKQLKFNCGTYTQSISIISLVLTVSTLAVSISAILDEALTSFFQGSDIIVGIYSEEYDKAVAVLNNEKVPSYVIQKRTYVQIDGKWVEISGIPVDKYSLKNHERVTNGSREEVFGRLKDPNTIIITTTFAKNHNKAMGDMVKVQDKELKVVGVVNSFESMGTILFVADTNYPDLFKDYDYCVAMVDTGDIEATRLYLNTEFEKSLEEYSYSVDSSREVYEANASDNRLIINIIYFLCAFSLVISSISMISNLIINMISRRSDFLIYRTIGLTKKTIRRMVLYEALSIGIYSGATGVAMGCALLPVLASILSYYIGSVGYSYYFDIMAFLMCVACGIAVFSVLFTVQKYVFKMNLIEEIKRV
ncbi:MAG: ABC transporter permease [Peptococcaceae bacterium]|nr:ABC transporter permease [Peptococcaceae bacterium]